MLGLFWHWRGTGQYRYRIDKIHGGISGAASLAVIAVLIIGLAFGASAFNVAIGEKQIFFRIKRLHDKALGDMAVGLELGKNLLGQLAVLARVGGVVVVVVYQKAFRNLEV